MTSGSAAANLISERIRSELLLRRVHAPEVARLLGHDVKTIHRHLRGETDWPANEVWVIAEYLHIPATELTGACS
jgi:hypothetical protein